jgi:CRISPR-associated protein Csd1
MLLTSLARFCVENHVQKEPDEALYIEALRALSAGAGEHRADIGGLQILFWSDNPEGDAFLSGALGAVADYWYYRSSPTVRTWLERLDGGTLCAPCNAGVFHVLGLAQSEAQPVIQFWITDTFEGLADRVRAFWDDLRFASPERHGAAILHMMQEAVFARDFDQIAPRLTQDLLAAMLTGTDFPPRLLQTVVERIRADGQVDGRRAGVLKAVLARRSRLSGGGRPAPVELDPAAADPAYRLGRLFAVFDAIWALDGDRIRPSMRFRTLAAAAPGLTAYGVGGLARLALNGAKVKDGATVSELRQVMDQLLDGSALRLPPRLSTENQARFALGLYQQQQALSRRR